MVPIDELRPEQQPIYDPSEPGVHMAQISADALIVIEGIKQDHLLLCEELTFMEQIAAIPNIELQKDRETLTQNNFLRMQSRRRLDEAVFYHAMDPNELKAHLEQQIALGDCLLCEWFKKRNNNQ